MTLFVCYYHIIKFVYKIKTIMDFDGHFVSAQLALSGRSECRGCKVKIEKG